MPAAKPRLWRDRAAAASRLIENALLSLLLLGMTALAAVQIVLRNWFSSGLLWADDLVRLGVLWLAMVGAVAASRDNRHLSINLVERYAPDWIERPAAIISGLFATVVVFALTWHAGRFVFDSYRFEDTVLGDLPAWPFQLVMPIGFLIIGMRFLLRLIGSVRPAR
ncbi:MAG: TRAP transporter small permease [Gammaproteobacteria bacterium]|nr:TRAP transporter small permease [Gammaproteobacteria bacterium]